LRRAVPSFTVEVRRRPRLAITSKPDGQSAAAFGARKVGQSPVDVAASPPRGRILPSLVPEESLRRPLRDAALTTAESEPPSRAPKRPSVQTSKSKDQASKSPQNSSFSSAASAPVAERLSIASRQPSNVQPDEGAGVSPRDPTRAPTQVAENSGSLALRAKAKGGDEAAIARDDVSAKPWPNDQRSAIETDSLAR
jgi:hypothetical protein